MHGGNIIDHPLTAIIEDAVKWALGVLPVPGEVMKRFEEDPFINSQNTDDTLKELGMVIDVDLHNEVGQSTPFSLSIEKVDDFVSDTLIENIPTLRRNEQAVEYLNALHADLTDENFNVNKNQLIELLDAENRVKKDLMVSYLTAMVNHLSDDGYPEYIKMIKTT